MRVGQTITAASMILRSLFQVLKETFPEIELLDLEKRKPEDGNASITKGTDSRRCGPRRMPEEGATRKENNKKIEPRTNEWDVPMEYPSRPPKGRLRSWSGTFESELGVKISEVIWGDRDVSTFTVEPVLCTQ